MKRIISIICLTVMAFSVHAGGFRVALQSAKQIGMSHVGAGMSLGPESIFFNPGAVAFGESGISISGNAALPNTTFSEPRGSHTTKLVDNVGTPFAVYGSKKINDKFAAGLGIYTPYGNKLEWEEDFAGRAISQSIDLKAIFIQPTVSYKISDKFGIGAGFIYTTGNVELIRAVPNLINAQGQEMGVTLETDKPATGMGYNVGAFYQPSEKYSFGVNFRSKITAEARDGNVLKSNMPLSAASLFSATKFDADLPLPSELALGVAYMPNEKLTVAFDANHIWWNQYEVLTFHYNDVMGGETTTAVPQNWDDAWTLKLGGQYEFNETWTARAGTYLDFTPIPDETLSPITPDADRFNTTFGGSYTKDRFSVDAGILFVNSEERTVLAENNQFSFNQRYKIKITAPSIGFNYSLK